jgi:hypothetical protein
MKKKLMVFITLLFVGISLTMAQGRKVIGSVISSEDNEPIAGASIQVKGTKIGTITNSDGQFTLFNVPSTAKVLVISYIGMKTVEVTIRSNVQVVMESANKQLDEVVVTAQGLTRKEKSLGYSTQKITAEKLTVARQTDLRSMHLAGKIAGARFISRFRRYIRFRYYRSAWYNRLHVYIRCWFRTNIRCRWFYHQ